MFTMTSKHNPSGVLRKGSHTRLPNPILHPPSHRFISSACPAPTFSVPAHRSLRLTPPTRLGAPKARLRSSDQKDQRFHHLYRDVRPGDRDGTWGYPLGHSLKSHWVSRLRDKGWCSGVQMDCRAGTSVAGRAYSTSADAIASSESHPDPNSDSQSPQHRHRHTHPHPHPPRSLHILFCGADEFSIPSLRALAGLMSPPLDPPTPFSSSSALPTTQDEVPPTVASITVLCRPPKGFWKRNVVGTDALTVPVDRVARDELGLPVYYVDRFGDRKGGDNKSDEARGWEGKKYDLVVASSFGIKIPAWVIEGSTYGGVNVHPSMLPDLKGASPLQYTLLLHRPFTGLSIQTLDPDRLDGGTIISQTAYPGFPVAPGTRLDDLTDWLAHLGAGMLARCVQSGLFVGQGGSREKKKEEEKKEKKEEKDEEGKGTGSGADGLFSGSTARTRTESRYPPGWANDPAHLEHFRSTVGPVARAPKISIDDRRIRWDRWAGPDFPLRHAVLGDLWDPDVHERCRLGGGGSSDSSSSSSSGAGSEGTSDRAPPPSPRVIFHGWEVLSVPDGSVPSVSPGTPFLVRLLHPDSDPDRSRTGEGKKAGHGQGHGQGHGKESRAWIPPPQLERKLAKPRIAFRAADGSVVVPVRATIGTKKAGVGLIKLVEMMKLAPRGEGATEAEGHTGAAAAAAGPEGAKEAKGNAGKKKPEVTDITVGPDVWDRLVARAQGR